ncbi:peptidase S8/S53 domain-containing protein, partial [Blyttiomyces helicus]
FDIPGLQGYAGPLPDSLLQKIRESDEVEYVEKDQIVYALNEQQDAPWGLSRVTHRQDWNKTETPFTYTYYPDAGKDVFIYIIDTGINIDHVDFEGRAQWGITVPAGDFDKDGNGHGTHCAGTVAGAQYGVAKKATVVAVKVLRSNGSGTMSDVIRGVEWTINSHKERSEAAGKGKKAKSVANMSLGGGMSRALNRAVDAAVEAGIYFAVAAGNNNQDACDFSPASAEKAITVGATTIDDSRAWFSNWGKRECTDIFGPGHQILSTWIGSNSSVNTLSGTSMASPHVAGVVAALLSRPEFETLNPLKLKKSLTKLATRDVLTGLPQNT